MPEPDQVTSLDVIREQAKERTEGKLLTLPSGIKLKIRRPSISTLLRDDKVPQALLPAAIRMATNQRATTAKEISENVSFMEHIVFVSLVEPVGMTEEDIANLSDEDKGFCFLYIQGEVADLKSFRSKQSGQTS